MNKKVLVLGAMGMAGHVMVHTLRKHSDFEVFGVARQEGSFVDKVLDVSNFPTLKSYILELKPDYIVNCVGVLVAQAQKNITTAVLLNSYLPHFLAELGDKEGFKLIHISTDCVFSGKTGAYLEDSFRDGDDNYARSKALGEVICDKHLTVRTSIVGPELKKNGTSLFDFFLKQQGVIQGYTKAIWSGVTTLTLAQAVMQAIKDDVMGLYHLTNGEPINKYELLLLFKKHTGRELEVQAVEGKHVNKSLVDTRGLLSDLVPSYDKMVENMLGFMRENKEFYSHYSI
jgi:dTDP-4-dehydrorhamnose reductase